MLSTFPVYTEPAFVDPFNNLEPGWDTIESVIFSPQVSQEPVSSNTGSDTSNPNPVTPYSFPEDSPLDNPEKVANSSPGSTDSDRVKPKRALDPKVLDERKRRRMISNRDSARRSRMRKQRHLENLRNLLNRLKVTNRELSNRVRVLVHQDGLVRRENQCLRSEAVVLRQRLWDFRQVLVVRQLQQHLSNNDPYALPRNNNNDVNYNNNNIYSANHNVMSARYINNDGHLNHHSLIT